MRQDDGRDRARCALRSCRVRWVIADAASWWRCRGRVARGGYAEDNARSSWVWISLSISCAKVATS
ncbi:hypothetical protein [Lysobacter gummosus]|uniref:hypothetical protein n=1 Tax=Lysobacter gummosus TaxID=262324 RepID=UPI0036308702